jgi:putative heme iron utilization protein
VAPDGAVLMLLSALSAHTAHLRAEPRCALMVSGQAATPNPQTAPRVTIMGTAILQEDAALRGLWVRMHPYAAAYADFTDFSLWRLLPREGHYVGGFAMAHRLSAVDLRPDAQAAAAVAGSAERIIAHCNSDHAAALDKLAAASGLSGHWLMHRVDTEGFDLLQDDSLHRIAFDRPVASAQDIRSALMRMIDGLAGR